MLTPHVICGGAVKILLLLLLSLSCAPQLATFPRPPVIVMPVVADTEVALIDATFNALLFVSRFCLPAMVVAMSTPVKYSWGANRLDWTMAEPDISIDGALTGALHTMLPALIPSRSTLFESASDNVPDAGLIRAHVKVPTVTRDELLKVGCLDANWLDKSVTSAIAMGPVDCCAWLMFWPFTVNVPVTDKFPVMVAPVSVNPNE